MDYNFRIGDMIISERDPQSTWLILSCNKVGYKVMAITGEEDGQVYPKALLIGKWKKIGNILERNGGKK